MKASLGIALVALLGCATQALCQTSILADYTNINIFKTTLPGFDLGMNYQFDKYVSFEAAYQGGFKSGISLNGAYAAATIDIPLLSSGFDAFVSGGGSVLSGETPIQNGFEARWDAGLIADAGVVYHFTSSWGLRAAYRYQTALAHSDGELVGLTFSF
jgi:opacity protein-like surface antigen